jgi:hypothetical protein
MKAWMQDLLKRIREDAAKAYKSWTVVINAISAGLGGAWLYLMANPDVLAQAQAVLPQLDGLLSPKVLTLVTMAFNVINVILRFKTSGRIADK